MKDAKEGGASPVRTRQCENGPQVVEGDVALRQRALQPGLLEGGPLLLEGPSSAQVTLVDRWGWGVGGGQVMVLIKDRNRLRRTTVVKTCCAGESHDLVQFDWFDCFLVF